MRNLKKILALVLALVMSLSLMATAGAAETTAAAADPYATAQTVLTGLKVFRGDTAGQMNWNQPITRVQTAALVYRINTGDVDDTKAGLHTSNPFADVAASYWGNSYISYGYNAGILKGMGGNNFAPDNQVTGYQTLAMILRAMGYGRNGEFEGTGWEVRTASTAQSLGLLKNVTPSDSTTLGQPASRGLVAEILLRALLTNKVMYSALNPYNYTELDEKLADNLGLEEQTGVVIANEWAALDDTKPLAADKTKVQVADGTYRTLDWGAESYAAGIEDIGQSRSIYIQNGSKVLLLADSGKNVVKVNENGAEKTRAAVADGLTINSTTEYYENFDPAVVYYSDMRIEYNLRFENDTAAQKFFKDFCTASWKQVEDTMDEDNSAAAADYKYAYVKVIGADKDISDTDMAIMKGIFTIADNVNKTLGIDGSVYIGTRSGSASDYSDDNSYKTFVEKQLNKRADPIAKVGNGNDMRIIDNNSDGVAEYVLLITYELDTIVETKSDKFYYRGLDIEDITPAPIDGYTQTVGDVVLYAVIDGKAYVHKAVTDSATFKSVHYKDVYAIDTNDKKWEESDTINHTTLADQLVDVDELTLYTLYLDDHGYIRAYDGKVGYALLTEMYPSTDWNSAWVVGRDLTAEAMLVGDTAVREYKVLNNYYNGTVNPFYTSAAWRYPGITTDYGDTIYHDRVNWLTPATHMLDVITGGTDREGITFDFTERDWFWQNGQANEDGWENLNSGSWTNVAKYTQTSDGLNLYTAAEHNGTRAVSDYIRLNPRITDWRDINKNTPLFEISDPYYDEVLTSANDHYVRTVDNTVFYLVVVDRYGKGTQAIRQYTGYSNVPTLTDENEIRSMYAVAHNANGDTNTDNKPYWVADVVVIEMYDYDVYESVSLIYSNNYKNQNDVKYVEAIDSKLGAITIIPNSYNVWNGRFQGYGFYGLNNVVAVEGQENTYTADITRIVDGREAYDELGWYENNEYNKHGIYYGQVRSIYSEDAYSNYVTLDILDQNGIVVGDRYSGTSGTKDVRVTLGAWGIKGGNNDVNTAMPLVFKSTTVNNKVEEGDRVIWVQTSDRNDARTAGFLIDLTDTWTDSYGVSYDRDYKSTPTFLKTEGVQISRAQWDGKDVDVEKYWNYEEIIGKRNDLTTTPRTLSLGRPQEDGYVVAEYDIYVNGELVTHEDNNYYVADYIGTDGLWHIRYYIPEDALVTIEVRRDGWVNERGSNLILNGGINAGTETSWTFRMPKNLAKNQVVVGTIFESGNIPAAKDIDYPAGKTYTAIGRVFATREVCVAYENALNDLSEARTVALKAVENNAELTADVIAAYNTAVAAVTGAAAWNKNDVPAIESAATTGVVAIKEAAGIKDVVDPTPEKTVDEAKAEAMDALDAAKAAADAAAGGDTGKLDAIQDAYDKAVAAVEAADTVEEVEAAQAAGVEAIQNAEPEQNPDLPDVSVKFVYTLNGLGETGLDQTKSYKVPEGAATIIAPRADVEQGVAGQFAVTVNGAPVTPDGEGGYAIPVPEDLTETVVVEVAITVGTWGPAGQSERIHSARTLANDVRLKGTLITRTGVMPVKNSEPVGVFPASFQFDWSTMKKDQTVGNWTTWYIEATISASDAETVDYSKMAVTVNKTEKDTSTPSTEYTVTVNAPADVDYTLEVNSAKVESGAEIKVGDSIILTVPEIDGKTVTIKAGTEDYISGETYTVTEAANVTFTVTVENEEKIDAPVLAIKVMKDAKELADAATLTLSEGYPKENIAGGVITYNYEYAVAIAENTKYALSAAAVKDANDTPAGTVTVNENIITVKGVSKDAGDLTLVVTLADASVVTVTVSDSTVLNVSPSVLLAGSTIAGTEITLSLKDGMADKGYSLPNPIVIDTYTYGEDYSYDAATGKITLKKGGAFSEGNLNISSPANIKDGVTVTFDSGSGGGSLIDSVGPQKIAAGTPFSSGFTITITPKTGYSYPASVSIAMTDNIGNAYSFTSDDFSYDPSTGVITVKGDRSVTGPITVTAGAVAYEIAELTVTYNKSGVVTVNPARATGQLVKWMLVDPEDDATLFATVAGDVASWTAGRQYPFALTNLTDGNYNFTDGGNGTVTPYVPALTSDDNGSYLVVVWVGDDPSAGSYAGLVTAAGCVLVSGVEGGASDPTAPLTVLPAENSHLKGEIKDGVIVLTPEAGYSVPMKSGVSVTMNDAAVEAFDYTVNADGTATISINGGITGPVVVTAKGEKPLSILTVSNNKDGKITAKDKDGTTVNVSDAADVVVYLASDVTIADKLAALSDSMTVDNFLNAVLGSNRSGLSDRAIAGNGDLKGNAECAYTKNAAIMVLNVEDGKVVSAGVGENKCWGPAPALDVTTSTDNQVLGVDIAVTAANAKSSLSEAKTAKKDGGVGLGTTVKTTGDVKTKTTPVDGCTVEMVFVAGDLPDTDDWNTLKTKGAVITDTATALAAMTDTTKNENVAGFLFIKVAMTANPQNATYYVAEVTNS